MSRQFFSKFSREFSLLFDSSTLSTRDCSADCFSRARCYLHRCWLDRRFIDVKKRRKKKNRTPLMIECRLKNLGSGNSISVHSLSRVSLFFPSLSLSLSFWPRNWIPNIVATRGINVESYQWNRCSSFSLSLSLSLFFAVKCFLSDGLIACFGSISALCNYCGAQFFVGCFEATKSCFDSISCKINIFSLEILF